MHKKINCLIFDFDGVIADTDKGRFKIIQKALWTYNIKLTIEKDFQNLIGLSSKSFLKKYYPELTDEQIAAVVKQRHEVYYNNLNEYCIPFEDMKESIAKYAEEFELSIATANTTENVKRQLNHLGISGYFNRIIGSEICENDKLVKSYRPVRNALNRTLEECIVIEDSDIGVKAATDEGFFCIRFDPYNRFNNQIENDKAYSYKELNDKIQTYSSL